MSKNVSEQDLELLSSYLDGACHDTGALRARLDAEPELALRLRQLQDVRMALAALPVPTPSPGFAEAVSRRAGQEGRVGQTRRAWWYAATAAAALAMITAGLLWRAPGTGKTVPGTDRGEAWQTAMSALAEQPDAMESAGDWLDMESVPEDALPGDLEVALADRSAAETEGDYAEMAGFDANTSVFDVIDTLDEEDAAALAAMLESRGRMNLRSAT